MSNIFISYRRDDSGAACGHIYERLHNHFGRDSLFKDVDDIPWGVRFPDYLAQQLAACRVELVVIGRFWLTLTTPNGKRRLDAPGDFVRTEIEVGLRNGLIVVPLLVDNATMPHADQLPTSIRKLVELQGAQVRNDPDFDTDMQRLIRQLERRLGIVPSANTRPTPPLDPRADVAMQAQIEKLLQEISAVGDGDLRVQAEVTPDTMGVLADSFNYMIEEMAKLVAHTRATAFQVTNGTRRLQERLLDITNAVDSQVKMVEGIARAANERAQTPEAVVSAMSHIAEITRQTSAAMQDANVSAIYLAELAEQLRASVATFRLPDQDAQGRPLLRN